MINTGPPIKLPSTPGAASTTTTTTTTTVTTTMTTTITTTITTMTTTTTTTARTTTAQTLQTTENSVSVWTWWTPDQDKGVDDKIPSTASEESMKKKPNDMNEPNWTDAGLQSLLGVDMHDEPWENKGSGGKKESHQVINKDTTEKMTSDNNMGVNTNNEGNESGSEINALMDDKKTHQESENLNNIIKDDDDKNIKDKYLELVAHNTRLVDVLRTTLELQAELFRRITRYLFP